MVLRGLVRHGWGPLFISVVLVAAWDLSGYMRVAILGSGVVAAVGAVVSGSVVGHDRSTWIWSVFGLVSAAAVAESLRPVVPTAAIVPYLGLVLPVAMAAVAIWVVCEWLRLHSTYSTLPRLKHLPTLLGLLLATFVWFTYTSQLIYSKSVTRLVCDSIEVEYGELARRIDSVVHAYPSLASSAYLVMLLAATAVASVVGDTRLASRLRNWARLQAAFADKIRENLATVHTDDPNEREVRGNVVSGLSELYYRVAVASYSFSLALRATPELVVAAVLDVFFTVCLNTLATIVITVRAMIGGPAAFLSGAMLYVGILALTGHIVLEPTSRLQMSAHMTIALSVLALAYLAFISDCRTAIGVGRWAKQPEGDGSLLPPLAALQLIWTLLLRLPIGIGLGVMGIAASNRLGVSSARGNVVADTPAMWEYVVGWIVIVVTCLTVGLIGDVLGFGWSDGRSAALRVRAWIRSRVGILAYWYRKLRTATSRLS